MSAPAYQSLTEFYRDPTSPYAGFAHEHRSGGSMPVKLIRAKQGSVEAIDPPVPSLLLAYGIDASGTMRRDIGYGLTPEHDARGGDMAFVPAYTEARYNTDGFQDLLFIDIPAVPLANLLAYHARGTLTDFDALTASLTFRDEPIRRTLQQLWTESARFGGTSDLLIDGLTQVLIARLLDKAGAIARPATVPTLSKDEIARLDRLIADRLAERITVETLAQALDMPRWTFADAFKATLGETPHAYVTARRVERACDLLRLGDLPLAEIAYATGFSSQSHMTDTFRRVLDTTPGAWRREVRK